MLSESFCCPVCKGTLLVSSAGYRCEPCARSYQTVGGIPDFFISETERDFIDQPNRAWLDPEIVEARDTVYRLCARELKGMSFCIQEIGRRTGPGCRVLEVGMGTGHFTRWLAEVSAPGTEIYAFDFSWPIIEKAQANTQELSGITLFRANARGRLPFRDESFDIVFLRLAPLGLHGVPSVLAGYELLKPGGWYFEAGWEQERYETPPTEWAVQHGYENVEYHVWQYRRTQTQPERAAMRIELEHLASLGCRHRSVTEAQRQESGEGIQRGKGGGVSKMTHERLLVAQKPV